MKYHYYLFLFLAALIMLAGCGNLASVEEVTDPKEISPVIQLSKSLNNETGSVNSTVKVTLYDKEEDIVEIDGGSVLVNGITMSPPYAFLFGSSRNHYYTSLLLEPDSLYFFEIRFSDGESYNAWIKTPEIDLIQMDVPLTHKRKTDLQVKWLHTDHRYPQRILIQFYNDGFSTEDQYEFTLRYPYSGTYTIDKKYVKYTERSAGKIKETRIKAIAETSGALDENFQPGGSIVCKFKIYQDIEIY